MSITRVNPGMSSEDVPPRPTANAPQGAAAAFGATPASAVSRVLLVDEDTQRAALLTDLLKDAGVRDVFYFQATGDLLDKVLQIKPDLVLVEVDSPRRDTLEQLTGVAHRLPVLLVAKDRSPEAIRAAIASGVSSYVVDGISPEAVQPAIGLAAATFQRFAALKAELDQARAQIEHKRVIEQAKLLLIEQSGCDEAAAYRTLQKLAMDGNRRIVEVARELLRYAAVLRGGPPSSTLV